MKKLVSVLLCVVMLCTLTMPALADELRCDPPLPPPSEPPVEPTPPSWFPEEHYLVFPDDPLYLPENWANLLELRAEAAKGEPLKGSIQVSKLQDCSDTPAAAYELGLIRLRYVENLKNTAEDYSIYKVEDSLLNAVWNFSSAAGRWEKKIGAKDDLYWQAMLWSTRIYGFLGYGGRVERVAEIVQQLDMPLDEFFDAPYMDWSEQRRTQLYEDVLRYFAYLDSIKVYVDGALLLDNYLCTMPELRGNCLMVPANKIAGALGAEMPREVQQKTTLTRAGVVVELEAGKTTAYVNEKPVKLDAAPYLFERTMMVPLNFICQTFGQIMTWDAENETAYVVEDKSAVGKSNMEAWALPMGAMLVRTTYDHPEIFGVASSRCEPLRGVVVMPSFTCRARLSSASWGIESREELIYTVCAMTVSGHNDSFLLNAAYINSLSPAQYNQYRDAYEINTYMVPYTKQLSQKWGDRGILCWDLFRMATLVQWGYTAGYLTYVEALALLEPAATLLCENFSSWDEAYENYLDGYNWWARNNVLDQNIWETERGELYLKMKDSSTTSAIFDDTLFKTGVISVPGVTAEELLESVLG